MMWCWLKVHAQLLLAKSILPSANWLWYTGSLSSMPASRCFSVNSKPCSDSKAASPCHRAAWTVSQIAKGLGKPLPTAECPSTARLVWSQWPEACAFCTAEHSRCLECSDHRLPSSKLQSLLCKSQHTCFCMNVMSLQELPVQRRLIASWCLWDSWSDVNMCFSAVKICCFCLMAAPIWCYAL